jgi:(2Fe-2S) ferredoxin
VPRPGPEASLHIAAPLGAGGVSTGCLRLCMHLLVLPNDILVMNSSCMNLRAKGPNIYMYKRGEYTKNPLV